VGAALDRIRSYYESLNSADADAIAAHFTPDAVHYYTRLGPHRGREIAENACWAIENLGGRWHLEHGIEQGDEAVIEWAMTWSDPDSGERRINRGGPRLSPRRPLQPEGQLARIRPRGARPHHPLRPAPVDSAAPARTGGRGS
jgi:hypothetical protein